MNRLGEVDIEDRALVVTMIIGKRRQVTLR